jgi:transposase
MAFSPNEPTQHLRRPLASSSAACLSAPTRTSRQARQRRPPHARWHPLDSSHWRTMARPTRGIRSLANRIQTLQCLVQVSPLVAGVRRTFTRRGPRSHSLGRLLHQSPSALGWRKRGGDAQAIGRSRGGLTTKIHALVDALGNPLHLQLTGGQVHDSVPALSILSGHTAQHVIADKAYDVDAIVAEVERLGATAVIPPKRNRRQQRPYDKHLYKERHLVECFFCKIKEFRRVATRYEKLAITFLAMVTIAACLIWLR